jgi:hypothetical protein
VALLALVLLPALHPGPWTHAGSASAPKLEASAHAADPCALCAGATQVRSVIAPLYGGVSGSAPAAGSRAEPATASLPPSAPWREGCGPRAPPRLA